MKRIVLAAALLLLAACGKQASNTALPASPPAPAAASTLPGAWARADADGDGAISRAEFEARGSRAVMKRDADGDGKVSQAEWDAGAKGGAAKPGKGPFARFDADRDGYLSAAEIVAITDARFKRADRNGDGRLTPDEIQALRDAAAVAASTPKKDDAGDGPGE